MVLYHKGLSMTLCTCDKEPSMICTSSSTLYPLCAHKLRNQQHLGSTRLHFHVHTSMKQNRCYSFPHKRRRKCCSMDLKHKGRWKQNRKPAFVTRTITKHSLVKGIWPGEVHMCVQQASSNTVQVITTNGLTKYYTVRFIHYFISILVSGRWVHSSF